MQGLAISALFLFLLSACAPTRLSRTPQESLLRTVRDPASRTCGILGKPREYCGIPTRQAFDHKPAPEDFSSNPVCEKFYAAAIHASDIQCDYEEEISYTHKVGQLSDTPYIVDRLKQIHIRYQEAAEIAAAKLESTFAALERPSEEQERTYKNIAWSLGAFTSLISFKGMNSGRKPASTISEHSHVKVRAGDTVPQTMRRLIIGVPPPKKSP